MDIDIDDIGYVCRFTIERSWLKAWHQTQNSRDGCTVTDQHLEYGINDFSS